MLEFGLEMRYGNVLEFTCPCPFLPMQNDAKPRAIAFSAIIPASPYRSCFAKDSLNFDLLQTLFKYISDALFESFSKAM